MLLLPIILLVAVGNCQGQRWREEDDEEDYGQCLTSHGPPTRTDPNTRKQLIRSRLEFSIAFFKQIAKESPSDNVFMSPLSVYNTLMLAYFTAAGNTEQSIRQALSLPTSLDKADVLKAYSLHKHNLISGRYKSQVHSANRLFVSDQQTVKECMIDIFNDEIELVDFSPKGLSQTVGKINFWVSNHTGNKIQDLVSERTLSPNSQIVLANAAYFKGAWKNVFDPEDTKMRKFYVNKNKTVSTLMMFQLNDFSHWRSDQIGAELLELPYLGPEGGKSNISLILMLPDQSNSQHPASDLVLRLNAATLLDIVRDSSNPNNEDKVEVRMPKFSLESTFELTDVLESMGVGDLFRPTSNLTGLTGGPKINLNSAIHKAKVRIDEYGTEAAAATIFTETRIPGENFYLDHPFVYLLYDKTEESLLFAGVYNYPEETS